MLCVDMSDAAVRFLLLADLVAWLVGWLVDWLDGWVWQAAQRD